MTIRGEYCLHCGTAGLAKRAFVLGMSVKGFSGLMWVVLVLHTSLFWIWVSIPLVFWSLVDDIAGICTRHGSCNSIYGCSPDIYCFGVLWLVLFQQPDDAIL